MLSPLSETCLIEDFTAFLTIPNEPLQIATLDFLCDLCTYQDEALKGMVYFRTITEVRLLICSGSTPVVGKALNFFLNWVINTTEYYSLLLDEISDIDFVAVCQQQPCSLKLMMTELLLRLSQNAIPYHLQKIMTEDFILTMFDQLEVIGPDASHLFFDAIIRTAQKCQDSTNFIQMLHSVFRNETFGEEFQGQADEVIGLLDSLLENNNAF